MNRVSAALVLLLDLPEAFETIDYNIIPGFLSEMGLRKLILAIVPFLPGKEGSRR